MRTIPSHTNTMTTGFALAVLAIAGQRQAAAQDWQPDRTVLPIHVQLFVNDQQVAEGTVERTQAMIFSADETADVDIDLGTPVVEAIGAEEKSKFTGKIPKLTVELRDIDAHAEAVVKQAWAEARLRTE